MKYLILISLILSCSPTAQDSKNEIPFNPEIDRKKIHEFLNDWHQAAAVADENVFFASIKDGGIYLGTDRSERWTKKEFMDWGIQYFTERDTAWSFTPFNRNIYFSNNGDVAWFEEELETWMGYCRGSGIIERNQSKWEIAHYNLAVTVDNELIQEFIALSDKEGEN